MLSLRAVRWAVLLMALFAALWMLRPPPKVRVVHLPAPTCAPMPSREGGGSRFAMVTVLQSELAEAWRAPLAAKHVYAAKHGYHHIVESTPKGMSLPEVAWYRPAAIMRYLEDYDWVMLMAVRSYVVNMSVPLERFASPTEHIVVADEDGPLPVSRMLMVRNSPEGHAFMKRWWGQLQRMAGEAWLDYDHGAFVQTLLETVVPMEHQTEDCLKHMLKADFPKYSVCASTLIKEHLGAFGQRVHSVVRFLPPDISWTRYCESELAERSKLDATLAMARPYHAYRAGDFAVMCSAPPLPSEGHGNPWMERVFAQTSALHPQLSIETS